MPTTSDHDYKMRDGFTLAEKAIARLLLLALVFVGALGVYLTSPVAAVAYLAISGVAGLLLVYAILCVRCPYPYHYNDCLFFPYRLLTVFRNRQPLGSRRGVNIGTTLVVAILALAPQYWLIQRPAFLAAFWAIAVALGSVFIFRFCRGCRNGACALCRNTDSPSI